MSIIQTFLSGALWTTDNPISVEVLLVGGGGAGGYGFLDAQHGAGGGGGGSGTTSGAGPKAGNGGSGIVIIRIPRPKASAVGTIVANGGTEITYTGNGTNGINGQGYKIHLFTGSSSLNVTQAGFVDVLVIAGGAGGGNGIIHAAYAKGCGQHG